MIISHNSPQIQTLTKDWLWPTVAIVVAMLWQYCLPLVYLSQQNHCMFLLCCHCLESGLVYIHPLHRLFSKGQLLKVKFLIPIVNDGVQRTKVFLYGHNSHYV